MSKVIPLLGLKSKSTGQSFTVCTGPGVVDPLYPDTFLCCLCSDDHPQEHFRDPNRAKGYVYNVCRMCRSRIGFDDKLYTDEALKHYGTYEGKTRKCTKCEATKEIKYFPLTKGRLRFAKVCLQCEKK